MRGVRGLAEVPYRFTLVTAVYNVARYLPEFMASVDSQDFPRDRVEIIAVDDGSTDESLTLLRDWSSRSAARVRVVTQPNAGQGAARNAGLALAEGEWVAFPDPDDLLAPGYLTAVDSYLTGRPDVVMAATARWMLDDSTGEVTDSHPLRSHFSRKDRTVDLDESRDWFFGGAPAAFFRLRAIRAQGLQFDQRVRPNFEDGHFCVRYLLGHSARHVAFIGSARYIYRRRSDGTSSLQTSGAAVGRFTAVMEHGYLAVLREASAVMGHVPGWLQSFVVYELGWLFRLDESGRDTVVFQDPDTRLRFRELLTAVVGHLDTDVIEGFAVYRLKQVWRDVLVHGYAGGQSHTPYAVVERVDEPARLARIAFRFGGPVPRVRFLSSGLEVTPRHSKVRTHQFFGETALREYIAWVPARRQLEIEVDGTRLELRSAWRGPSSSKLPSASRRGGVGPEELSRADRFGLAVARSAPVRRIFGAAWVLQDRNHDAGDSAETLFRYLRSDRRDINAWFVVERRTADWKRLRKAGYKRLVPHGSLVWRLLMANASMLISSHADVAVISPPQYPQTWPRNWRFAFLQHGVIKDDISAWLNPKRIDLFIASTRAEFDSLVSDDTPYAVTTREVALTELPRFDDLWRKARAVPPAERDLVVVAPTWRQWLQAPLSSGSQRREVGPELLRSDFMDQWLGFLSSVELKEALDAAGLTLGFLPHPNLQGVLDLLELPPHVVPLRYDDGDVQMLFARAAVLVTDYSSVAFNAAYMKRPVVYFQFDAPRFFGGDHPSRPGYFSYSEHGFGPVSDTREAAVRDVIRAVEYGRKPMSPYRERGAQAFPFRDGNACKRVVARIEKLVGSGSE